MGAILLGASKGRPWNNRVIIFSSCLLILTLLLLRDAFVSHTAVEVSGDRPAPVRWRPWPSEPNVDHQEGQADLGDLDGSESHEDEDVKDAEEEVEDDGPTIPSDHVDEPREPPVHSFRGRPSKVSAGSSSGDGCSAAPDSHDILVVIKTGATELGSKLPSHLLTLQNCVAHDQLLIFSDLEDTFAGHVIHDALANVSAKWRANHDYFKAYRDMKRFRKEGSDFKSLRGVDSWNIDKWKFLPLTFRTYELAPEYIKWFVFIEADTSLSWVNLLSWLRTMDPEHPHYLGAGAVIGDKIFAHGGSGYVMSRPAIAQLAHYRAQEGVDSYDARWEADMLDYAFGDEALSTAMAEAGIQLEQSNLLSGDKMSTLPYSVPVLCLPIVTMHHVDAMDVSDLWRLQAEWVREHGWGKTMPVRHIYENFAAGLITSNHRDWDNLSEDKKLIEEDVASEDEVEQEWFVRQKDMELGEQAALDSASECAASCLSRLDCIQWKWKPGRCYLGDVLRLGQREFKTVDENWTSGWLQGRVKKLMLEVEHCR